MENTVEFVCVVVIETLELSGSLGTYEQFVFLEVLPHFGPSEVQRERCLKDSAGLTYCDIFHVSGQIHTVQAKNMNWIIVNEFILLSLFYIKNGKRNFLSLGSAVVKPKSDSLLFRVVRLIEEKTIVILLLNKILLDKLL